MADFTITTTANFDAGTKTNIETNTDYNAVSSNEINIKLGTLSSDNFDGDSEGTSPPTGWVNYGGLRLANNEVDDTQSSSSPHSQWLKAKTGNHGVTYKALNFTTEKITYCVYFEDTTSDWRFYTQKTAVGYNGSYMLVYFWCGTDGKIYYYDSSTHDTGYTYSTGWHKFEFVHDFGADTFDAWYDGTKVVTGGGFRNTASSGVQIANFMALGADNEVWQDDIKVGGFYTTANWRSESQTMTAGYKLNDITITHSGLDGTEYIDKIEILDASDNSVICTRTTNITSGASTNLVSSDFDGTGFTGTADTNFKVKIYLVSDGTATPVITQVEGDYVATATGESGNYSKLMKIDSLNISKQARIGVAG